MEIGIQSRAYERFGADRYRMMYADGFRYCDLGLSQTNQELYNCEEADFLRLVREELALADWQHLYRWCGINPRRKKIHDRIIALGGD